MKRIRYANSWTLNAPAATTTSNQQITGLKPCTVLRFSSYTPAASGIVVPVQVKLSLDNSNPSTGTPGTPVGNNLVFTLNDLMPHEVRLLVPTASFKVTIVNTHATQDVTVQCQLLDVT